MFELFKTIVAIVLATIAVTNPSINDVPGSNKPTDNSTVPSIPIFSSFSNHPNITDFFSNSHPDTTKMQAYNTKSEKVIEQVSARGVEKSKVLEPCDQAFEACLEEQKPTSTPTYVPLPTNTPTPTPTEPPKGPLPTPTLDPKPTIIPFPSIPPCPCSPHPVEGKDGGVRCLDVLCPQPI